MNRNDVFGLMILWFVPQVAQSGVLLELDKSTLLEALISDFLQAAELDVLQATLRWGEHQLLRRMEDRG